MESLCLALEETAKLSSKVATPLRTSTSNKRGPITTQTHQHLVLSVFGILAILIGMQWYLDLTKQLFLFLFRSICYQHVY